MSKASDTPLRFAQIGDLHLTDPGLPNHGDFTAIVQELNQQAKTGLDFVYLPGDNADDGTRDQFALVRAGLNQLRLPYHVIPGDHDFKPRSLQAFYSGLNVPKLPYRAEVRGQLCLFLDVVSHGSGGPDFRLGDQQFAWLSDQLAEAKRDNKRCVVFMHAYPADLGPEADRLSRLLDSSPAQLVAMGHTHYNELSHDGHTIYAATRSTGQIEEGPVGFSLMALDGDVVSWRFKLLASPWPFVMITSPADRRLSFERSGPADRVRASVWGAAPITLAECRIGDGAWRPMQSCGDGLFEAPLEQSHDSFELAVRVSDETGSLGHDRIEVGPATPRSSTGSDAGSVGAWPDRHLFGTQLGPNRNGRKW
ncbi:metallophosphoesterase family protein [Rhodopseudomonas telluris]|uniref:Metallophosphoesterase family protein n=1 Tax=Rhodopseudomonas telluris TaxID=644215 RepID=A0ABV6ENQ2_9BRAD